MASQLIERLVGVDDVEARGGKLPREQILAVMGLVLRGVITQQEAIASGQMVREGRATLTGDDLAELLTLLGRVGSGALQMVDLADILALGERRLIYIDATGRPDPARIRTLLGL